jgi:hypothetical protein
MRHARDDYNERIQDEAKLIPVGEPVFLLRGQDPCAPSCVRKWASEAHSREVDKDMVKSALLQATAMEFWQVDHGVHLPDAPAGVAMNVAFTVENVESIPRRAKKVKVYDPAPAAEEAVKS